MLFFGVEMTVHVLLDALNNYGTGWLEPFSHRRFMFNVIYVADPFFALAPGLAAIVLAVPSWRRRWRPLAPPIALLLSGLYLGYCGMHAVRVRHEVHERLSAQGVTADRLLVTPTPLNNWLWYVVACDGDSCRVGFRSVFDGDVPLRLHAFARNEHLLDGVRDSTDVRLLLRFAQGFHTVERREGTLVFNDLRFGQVNGWADREGAFVFHWALSGEEDRMAVQRGRLAGWDRQSVPMFVRRMFGAQVGNDR
jgi:inner membrane protein